MKVGLFLNTQFPPEEPIAARVADLVAQVKTARDVGFASLWFPQHFLSGPLQMLQLTPIMSYMIPHAEGMQIGPNILILPLLNPVQVAEEAATLDVLSNGNYVLGIGLGYREAEFAAFNVPMKERVPRLEESLALIKRLWSGDTVTHKGRFYQVDNASISVRPVRPGGPPIWMAATVDVAIPRVARIGDAWMIVPVTPLDRLDKQMRLYRAALAEHHRTPDCFPIVRECYVADSHKTAMDECRGPLEYKYAAYSAWGSASRNKPPFEDYARNRFIIGDKSFVREEVARYHELLGVDHFMMRCHWPGLPFDKALANIRRIGEALA